MCCMVSPYNYIIHTIYNMITSGEGYVALNDPGKQPDWFKDLACHIGSKRFSRVNPCD